LRGRGRKEKPRKKEEKKGLYPFLGRGKKVSERERS